MFVWKVDRRERPMCQSNWSPRACWSILDNRGDVSYKGIKTSPGGSKEMELPSRWRYIHSMPWYYLYCLGRLIHWRYERLYVYETNHSLNRVSDIQYIPRNMHTVFALLCFVVVIHWLIFPYRSGLLHWHCGNLTIAPVPAKQPWWIWINTSYEFIMNDCITTTKQSTTKPCADILYCRWHFEVHFYEWKLLCFETNFTYVCSEVSIGASNDLAPNSKPEKFSFHIVII